MKESFLKRDSLTAAKSWIRLSSCKHELNVKAGWRMPSGDFDVFVNDKDVGGRALSKSQSGGARRRQVSLINN